MHKFMFWKKKKSPAEAAAQHLANLIGTSVAGFVPEPPNDKLDLDTELFVRNNVPIASLVIIAGLMKGNQNQKALILKSIQPANFREKSFENYLFTVMAEALRQNQDISSEMIENRIPDYSQVMYGAPATKSALEGDFFKWSQILRFEPTDAQIAKAIEQCQNLAKKNGRLGET